MITESVFQFQTGEPCITDVIVKQGLIKSLNECDVIAEDSRLSPHYLITDPTVGALYAARVLQAFQQLGYRMQMVVMPEGEASKTFSNYMHVCEQVLSLGIDEGSIIFSLGGGTVCNVAGFVAATLYRGIGLIHIPTTLMAQCDAAISHKQAINSLHGKNHIGSYYAPQKILVDIDVLATLADWLIEDGMAEAIKHALAQDQAYLNMFIEYDDDMRDPDFLEFVVKRNIALKCELMAIDPKENREGLVLQYGHTIGHPLEYLLNYEVSHGQAISMGMVVASEVANRTGIATRSLTGVHVSVLQKYKLPTTIPHTVSVSKLLDSMRYNKKCRSTESRMALLSDIGVLGQCDGKYAVPVSNELLSDALQAVY